MHPVPASCRLFLRVLGGLIAGLQFRVGASDRRPVYARKAFARRLASGLRIVEAYLRRVLILMALEIEPTLVDRSKPPLARPKERKPRRSARVCRFKVLDPGPGRLVYLSEGLPDTDWTALRTPSRAKPGLVAMAPLYRRLDRLASIAADPLRRATRLAFHLARSRPGPIIAPDLRLRLPQKLGAETSSSFNALAFDIVTRSRCRPPPLLPPRRYGPSLIALDW